VTQEQGVNLTVAGESERAALGRELSQLVRGEIRFSQHDRMLYATDASIYQIEPLGVVIPVSVDEMTELTAFCGRKRVPLLMRGGGTSLPGQCVNHALVVDYSPNCSRVVDVDEIGRAHV
jgi:FAD/FMN-containing dehydrogenase